MKLQEKIEIQSPDLKTIFIDGKMYYKQGKTTLYHPIDRILKESQNQASLKALEKACANLGETELQNRKTRGTIFHQSIEKYLKYGTIPHLSNLFQSYFESVEPILAKISKTHLVETAIPYKGKHPYAGKLDFFGDFQGKPCVIEWTTADEVKGIIDRLYDKPLQLTAFCGAVNQYYDLRVNYALIVVALPNQEAEIFEFNRDRLIEYWGQWSNRLEIFYNSITLS